MAIQISCDLAPAAEIPTARQVACYYFEGVRPGGYDEWDMLCESCGDMFLKSWHGASPKLASHSTFSMCGMHAAWDIQDHWHGGRKISFTDSVLAALICVYLTLPQQGRTLLMPLPMETLEALLFPVTIQHGNKPFYSYAALEDRRGFRQDLCYSFWNSTGRSMAFTLATGDYSQGFLEERLCTGFMEYWEVHTTSKYSLVTSSFLDNLQL